MNLFKKRRFARDFWLKKAIVGKKQFFQKNATIENPLHQAISAV